MLTDNRRVMASVAGRGRTLRLHRAFADAPETVLTAVRSLIFGDPRVNRATARAVINDFLESLPRTPGPEQVQKRRRVRAADRPHIERLRREYQRINFAFFAGALPDVPIYLSGRMRRRNGHFSCAPLEIVISRRLCTGAAVGEAEHTLRHEMIHVWQHAQGHKPGHGRDFRQWAKRLDVHPRATRAVEWASPFAPDPPPQ
ncbi:MAG TPA: SprT-like domain-containing protein [Longimicrobiaceae bacterium]|nr:SprT-like domain-containing protein [Longimicrobiaceae bacterium]